MVTLEREKNIGPVFFPSALGNTKVCDLDD